MTFFPANFATKTFAIEKKDAFLHEKTFAIGEKLGDKHNFLFIFSTDHSQGDNLKGLIAQETKDQGHQGTPTQKPVETKKLDTKTFASQEFSVISQAETFANFEFRLCLGRNFCKKCQKMRKL